MKLSWSTVGIFVTGLFLGILSTYSQGALIYVPMGLKSFFVGLTQQQLPPDQLCPIAKAITVKILDKEGWGSGVIIAKQGSSEYSVITNGHVLKGDGEFFTVETPDGRRHSASLLVRFDHGRKTGYDLAILQFESSYPYQVANLSSWTQAEKVMAAGFPVEPIPSGVDAQGLMCTPVGGLSRKLAKPMQEGYQLGYLLNIYNGMSGGPVLNEKGCVVGINGMTQPAFLVNSDLFLYRDGRRVSESLDLPSDEAMKFLSSSAWAITAESIVSVSPKELDLRLR